MNTPTITFTPNEQDGAIGKLTVSGKCTLEQLYNHPNCPKLIKQTLDTHVNWQMRCETPIHLALNLKNKYLPFRAAMAVYDIEDIEKDESIELILSDDSTTSSMVRPTPSHTPIVATFVRIKLNGGIVEDCSIAASGIEKRRISQVNPKPLLGQKLTIESTSKFASQVSQQFAGFDDFYGSADYRKAMLKVTLERALQEVLHE